MAKKRKKIPEGGLTISHTPDANITTIRHKRGITDRVKSRVDRFRDERRQIGEARREGERVGREKRLKTRIKRARTEGEQSITGFRKIPKSSKEKVFVKRGGKFIEKKGEYVKKKSKPKFRLDRDATRQRLLDDSLASSGLGSFQLGFGGNDPLRPTMGLLGPTKKKGKRKRDPNLDLF